MGMYHENQYLGDFAEGSPLFSEVDHNTATSVLGFFHSLLNAEDHYVCKMVSITRFFQLEHKMQDESPVNIAWALLSSKATLH